MFNIETATLMEGDFPNKERKLVEAWMEIHRDELLVNWNALNTSLGIPGFAKIPPLT